MPSTCGFGLPVPAFDARFFLTTLMSTGSRLRSVPAASNLETSRPQVRSSATPSSGSGTAAVEPGGPQALGASGRSIFGADELDDLADSFSHHGFATLRDTLSSAALEAAEAELVDTQRRLVEGTLDQKHATARPRRPGGNRRRPTVSCGWCRAATWVRPTASHPPSNGCLDRSPSTPNAGTCSSTIPISGTLPPGPRPTVPWPSDATCGAAGTPAGGSSPDTAPTTS